MVKIMFDEESEYGQDVLMLVALCVQLQETDMTMTQIRAQLKRINGQLNHIGSRIYVGNEEYWMIGGNNDGFRFAD